MADFVSSQRPTNPDAAPADGGQQAGVITTLFGGGMEVGPIPAEPRTHSFPMPVADFLAGNHLERADIMLSRKDGSFGSWLIRWATKSHFSHAALVFLVPHREMDFTSTFVIEAVPKGVDLTDLRSYLEDKTSIVAIKRFEEPWFDAEMQKIVRGRMLNFIKADYDFGRIYAILRMLFKRAVFSVRSRIQGRRNAIDSYRRRKAVVPGEFICSGFVQYGFYSAIGWLIDEKKLGPERLADVMFADHVVYGARSDDLLAVTPEDLAACEKLKWKYVMRDGMVYHTPDEASALAALDYKPKWQHGA